MEKKIKQTKEEECELILTPKSTILAYYIDEARCCNWNEHEYVCRYIHVGDIETHIHHTNWSVVNGQSNWTTENKHIILQFAHQKTMTQHNTHETGAARQSSGKKTSLKNRNYQLSFNFGGCFFGCCQRLSLLPNYLWTNDITRGTAFVVFNFGFRTVSFRKCQKQLLYCYF